jgi:hypothetical protein
MASHTRAICRHRRRLKIIARPATQTFVLPVSYVPIYNRNFAIRQTPQHGIQANRNPRDRRFHGRETRLLTPRSDAIRSSPDLLGD